MAEPFDISKFAQEAGINVGTSDSLELGVAARNIIPSLKKNLGDIITAVTNPIDTAQGLLSTGGGYLSKAGIPGLSEFEPYADAMNEMIANRYGSVDAVFNAIETDPVGVMMDFSGIAGVGGKIAKTVGLDTTADVLRVTSNVTDPISQTVNVAGGAAGSLISRSTPESMYGGGAKPGTTMTPQQRQQFNRTAVEQGIMPNEAGLARFGSLMQGLRNRIDALIDQATERGGTVDASVLFDTLDDMRTAVNEGGSVNKPGDLAQIEKVETALSRSIYGDEATDMGVIRQEYTVPRPLTARQLQNIKLDAYERGYRSSRKDKPPLREQAYQNIGRTAREQIEGLAGREVGLLNRELGNLLEMRGPLERAANRIDQRNFVSMPQTILAAPGIAARDPISGLLGAAAGGLITPENQARAGIMLERLRTMPRTPRTFVNRVPYLPRAGTAAAYGGRMQQGLLDRGLLPR